MDSSGPTTAVTCALRSQFPHFFPLSRIGAILQGNHTLRDELIEGGYKSWTSIPRFCGSGGVPRIPNIRSFLLSCQCLNLVFADATKPQRRKRRFFVAGTFGMGILVLVSRNQVANVLNRVPQDPSIIAAGSHVTGNEQKEGNVFGSKLVDTKLETPFFVIVRIRGIGHECVVMRDLSALNVLVKISFFVDNLVEPEFPKEDFGTAIAIVGIVNDVFLASLSLLDLGVISTIAGSDGI